MQNPHFIVAFIKAAEATHCQTWDVSSLAEEALGAFDLVDDWTELVFADLDWEMLMETNHDPVASAK